MAIKEPSAALSHFNDLCALLGLNDPVAADRQLLNHAVAPENPPLLIVSDMDRIIIRTN